MAPDKYGKKLKQLRELAGVSQAQLAHQINVDRAFVSMVESGYRSFTAEDAQRVEEYLRKLASEKVSEIQSVMELPALATA